LIQTEHTGVITPLCNVLAGAKTAQKKLAEALIQMQAEALEFTGDDSALVELLQLTKNGQGPLGTLTADIRGPIPLSIVRKAMAACISRGNEAMAKEWTYRADKLSCEQGRCYSQEEIQLEGAHLWCAKGNNQIGNAWIQEAMQRQYEKKMAAYQEASRNPGPRPPVVAPFMMGNPLFHALVQAMGQVPPDDPAPMIEHLQVMEQFASIENEVKISSQAGHLRFKELARYMARTDPGMTDSLRKAASRAMKACAIYWGDQKGCTKINSSLMGSLVAVTIFRKDYGLTSAWLDDHRVCAATACAWIHRGDAKHAKMWTKAAFNLLRIPTDRKQITHRKLAIAWAEAGDARKAEEHRSHLRDNNQKMRADIGGYRAFLARGDLAAANAWLESRNAAENHRDATLAKGAILLAKIRKWDDSVQILESITDSALRNHTAHKIACQMLHYGHG
ncbi:MAG: hypothetical protein KDK78_12215, partial [Chlamydiia bacterium]|nr:hypothetical protein [Chlamydiia bacterium]